VPVFALDLKEGFAVGMGIDAGHDPPIVVAQLEAHLFLGGGPKVVVIERPTVRVGIAQPKADAVWEFACNDGADTFS
jgi:hypothetical protein